MQSTKKTHRVYVAKELLDDVRATFPETTGLTYSGLNDFALRYLLKLMEAKEGD